MFIGILRIVFVWLVTLSVVSFIGGREKDFWIIFLMYGFYMTIPAIITMAIALIIETSLVDRGRMLAAVAIGPAFGLIFPALILIMTPNKIGALADMAALVPITLGAGLLWSAGLLPRLLASRDQ